MPEPAARMAGNEKAPPEGMGRARGRRPKTETLEERSPRQIAFKRLSAPARWFTIAQWEAQPCRFAGAGASLATAACKWQLAALRCPRTERTLRSGARNPPFSLRGPSVRLALTKLVIRPMLWEKKRLQPRLEPDDRAEAKSKVGPCAREEDMRRTGWTQAEGGGYGLSPVSQEAGPREEDTERLQQRRIHIYILTVWSAMQALTCQLCINCCDKLSKCTRSSGDAGLRTAIFCASGAHVPSVRSAPVLEDHRSRLGLT